MLATCRWGAMQIEPPWFHREKEPSVVSVLLLINMILGFYAWILIISAVASWLIAFNIVNTHNRVVASIVDLLYRLTEPVLRPLRRVIPNLGGLDLSPVVALFAIWFLQDLIGRYFIPAVASAGL